jgi:YidC/Oxa1 family membrane protein insertase
LVLVIAHLAVALGGHSLVVASLANPNPIAWLFDTLVSAVSWGLDALHGLTHNYGWAMILLALSISLLLLPLSLQSMKSMTEVQALAPYLKRLQQRYKNDRQKLAEEQMKLYKEHGVNPFGGCWPMLASWPFLYAVFRAMQLHNTAFQKASWLWIGSVLSFRFPHILATSLFQPDYVLLALYAASMYLSMKLTPTATMDDQQRQMMNTQAIIMPAFIFYFAYKFHWPSAFILYWLSFNVISMLERVWVMRMPSRIPKPPPETPATLAGYPHDCPNCNAQLVVVKGSKCEACGAKVRKLAPSDNGARPQTGKPAPAPAGSAKPDDRGQKKSP